MKTLPLETAFLKPALSGTILLAVGAALSTPAVSMPVSPIVPSDSRPVVQPVAAGDVPTVPRRRGGRRSKEKDKPYQPLSKDPVAESEAAHKDYLKRYGF